MIVLHAPILLVLMPLAASILITVIALRRSWLAHALATAGAATAALFAWVLLVHVVEHGAVGYHVAGWEPPWGIGLVADRLGTFVAAVVASVATLSLAWSRRPTEREMPEREGAFYSVASLALCGLLGMCVTGDAFNLFVFLEVASLAGYALIGAGFGRSRLAAFRYLILGATGASLYLLGVGYLYVATGTLNLADLAERVHDTTLAPAALAFIVTGLAIKMGLFPLHAWLPGAYSRSPSSAAAFAAPITTKVMALAMVRFIHQVFDNSAVLGPISVGAIIALMGAVAVVVGSLLAIAQSDFRRLLAWSSISQVGYIAIGIGIGTELALAAAMLHVLNHALMKGAMFQVAGAAQVWRMVDLRGLGRRMPITAAFMVVAGLSLVGIPPMGGFFSKWYLVQAALEAGRPIHVVAIVLGSLFAVFYVLRIFELAFLRPVEGEPRRSEPGWSMTLPLGISAIAIVVTGFLSQAIITNWLLEGGA